VVEEDKNQAPETAEEPVTEEPVAETPQDLIETGEAGLDAGPAKGPALDQDEGQVQTDTERTRRHPMYKKRVRRSKKFMVHDEGNEARIGDTVRIVETRPLSARKRWRLANIISRAE
jgi:small subunit ribosomal protein S17